MYKQKEMVFIIFMITSVLFINYSCAPKIQLFGCIEGDCKNGLGTWLESSGNKYIGNFRDGYRSGKGTYYTLMVKNGKEIGRKIKSGMATV